MFLHLGVDTIVPLRNVISIHDLKRNRSSINKEFIKTAESGKKVVYVTNENHKSFIITDQKIYYSPISPMTLKKRANYLRDMENNDE